MELVKLGAVLRPRTSWEAMDLGFAMGRTWLRPIYRAWLVAVLPAYALLWAALIDHPIIALILAWWLKPLWDQVPLFVVSRTMFGEAPTLGELLRRLPKLWLRQLFWGLFFYRLDPSRSFFQPVLQLEEPDGHTRGRRRRALMRGMELSTGWLTFICLCLELVIALGLFGLLVMLVPDRPAYGVSVLAEAWWDGTAPMWLRVAVPVIAFGALSGVEPLYVTAGFALYINRRTRLEGWDVELVFRRLAARLRSRGISAKSAGAAVAVAFALGSGAVAPAVASAEEAAPAASADAIADDRAPEAAARRVLGREEFGGRDTRTRWRRRNPSTPSEQREMGLLDGFGSCVAMGIEPVMWGLFAIILVVLLVLAVSRIRGRGDRRKRSRRPPVPEARVGLSIPPADVLPADIPAAAAELWRQGLEAHALGLLYKGAVSFLVEEGGLPIEDGATEGECLRIVRSKSPEAMAGFFASLTRAWQAVAYAHREPDEGAFGELAASWSTHFGGAR